LPYVNTDLSSPTQSNASPPTFTIANTEAIYGDGAHYGDGTLYGFQGNILTSVKKTYPAQDAKGYVFQIGVRETSTNPFNLIALIPEIIIDNPEVFAA